MKCQRKCTKEAVTTYDELPVCADCWSSLSYIDDHLQADEECMFGDYLDEEEF